MCFGGKNEDGGGDAPRPAHSQQPQTQQKATVPSQYQQQQRPQQQPESNDYAPPPGPPPSQRMDDYAPPSGPPPGRGGEDYAPPPGPPPSKRIDDYAAPPGPPPSHRARDDDLSYVAPPPGPPPTQTVPKSKHDWEAVVPDTSLFPPPPSFFSGYDRSPAHNATEAQAEAGERWCAQHPLAAPATLDGAAVTALTNHNPRLMQPDGFRGTLKWTAPGVWAARTNSDATDSTIIAYPPLYSVKLHSPLAHPTTTTTTTTFPTTNPFHTAGGGPRSKTIYYEVHLPPSRHANPPPGDLCLALGFAALPYPSFRMPGWHRGSLAVHGDDGHRFVNDRWGGKEFTSPFAPGDRLGLGMTFSVNATSAEGGGGGGRIETEVFFTRQGREVGRWNLHEETDAVEDLPVTGLEGYHDLSCAVGTCGKTEFEVVLDPGRWLFRPKGH